MEVVQVTLQQKAETLRAQLGLDAGLPIADIVVQAISQLGLESEVKALTMVEKVDRCLTQVMPTVKAQLTTSLPVAIAQPPQQPAVMQRIGMTVETSEDRLQALFKGPPTKSHEGCYLHVGLCGLAPHCVSAPDERTLRMRGCFCGWPLNEVYTTQDGIRYECDKDACGNPDGIAVMRPCCFAFDSCVLGPGCRLLKF
jgi:hypothetical protein